MFSNDGSGGYELGASVELKGGWAVLFEEFLIEFGKWEGVFLWVFTPVFEEDASCGVIGVDEEAEGCEVLGGMGSELSKGFMKVVGVVEGVALSESGEIG